MLTKPAISDERIVACLLASYDISVDELTFLPLGADQATAVYRVVDGDERPYFLKLRKGEFDALTLALPRFLGDQGIKQVIAPLTTTSDQLQATMSGFRLALYPFVTGRDGYETRLSEAQWRDLGAAFSRIHAATLPAALRKQIRCEAFSPRWRDEVKSFVVRAEAGPFVDPLAEEAAAFLIDKGDEILYLVGRAEQLAIAFQARSPEFVLCHADVHAGNILIAAGAYADGACYIVDWDEAILAPKERDLMSIGGGLMGGWDSSQQEEALFYRGYGQVTIDPFGLAYYRYERIIADIAVISEQLFAAADSLADRRRFFGYLTSNFLPGHTIEMATRADPGESISGR
ncbi:MAG: aminoglycoside phosphotransferase family protein [Chloroflexota bacterium]